MTTSTTPLAMRPWLRWLLVASVLASMVALWWPSGTTQTVERIAQASSTSVGPDTELAGSSTAVATAQVPTALPATLEAANLDKATFDPFVGVQPPPPPPPKPFVGPIYVAPAPAPVAPPFTYRYLGQITAPDGARLVYLTKADKDYPVSVGTTLDEGYVVESITAEGVQLRYPPLDSRVAVHIPPAQEPSR